MTDTLAGRKDPSTEFPIHPLLAARWSPRGLDAEFELDQEALGSLLEAARWTPSASNSQPWRFVVATRGSEDFDTIVASLTGANPAWAPRAAALIVICALTATEQGQPLRWAHYDAGQAAAHLSVQAESMDLSVHQMAGFRADDLREALDLPADVAPITVVAIGRLDPQADLPEPLDQREVAPRERAPLNELVLRGW